MYEHERNRLSSMFGNLNEQA